MSCIVDTHNDTVKSCKSNWKNIKSKNSFSCWFSEVRERSIGNGRPLSQSKGTWVHWFITVLCKFISFINLKCRILKLYQLINRIGMVANWINFHYVYQTGKHCNHSLVEKKWVKKGETDKYLQHLLQSVCRQVNQCSFDFSNSPDLLVEARLNESALCCQAHAHLSGNFSPGKWQLIWGDSIDWPYWILKWRCKDFFCCCGNTHTHTFSQTHS